MVTFSHSNRRSNQAIAAALKYLCILCTLFQLGNIAAAQAPNSTAYVYAPSGLKLRETPSMEGKKLASLPYGTKVKCLDGKIAEPFSVDGLTGNWQKVKYADLQGYLFDGYLAPLPAPDRSNTVWVTLKDYAKQYLQAKGKPQQLSGPVFNDTTHTRNGYLQAYDHGIDFYDYSEECDYLEVLHCRELNLQQAFLVVTSYLADFRGISLDIATTEGQDPLTGEPARFANLPTAANRNFQTGRYLFLIPKEGGGWQKIDLDFDSEPGSGSVEIKEKGEHEVVITFTYGCH